MKITFSGMPGAGKTKNSKRLAEILGVRRFYVGGIMRKMAVDRGMTIQELTGVAERDRGIDDELDRRQREIGAKFSDFVMDSRLGFYFVPDSYKIFLDVDIEEGARRIYNDMRLEEKYSSREEAKKFLIDRIVSEKIRYKEHYGISFPEGCDFDLRIDTTQMTSDEVVEKVLGSLPDECCD